MEKIDNIWQQIGNGNSKKKDVLEILKTIPYNRKKDRSITEHTIYWATVLVNKATFLVLFWL